jgi:rare lipoprotein A
MKPIRLLLLIPLIAASLSFLGCGGSSTSRSDDVVDGAPDRRLDPTRIPDAIPKAEPRSRYGNPAQYEVFGRTYRVMDSASGYSERGIASWYGTKFHGRRTSSGEPYDMYAMTAAHKSLPLPTYVRVTNLDNGRSAVVKVNDRGPFAKNRLIDLSYAAATKLGVADRGTARVEVTAIDPTQAQPQDERPRIAAGGAMFLQTGAFSSEFNAHRQRRLVEQVSEQPVRIERVSHRSGALHRVQVGPVYHVDQIDQLAQALADLGIMDTTVIIP